MALFNKPLNEITIDDINELVANGIGESRTLDYKLEVHSNGDSGKKELLKDLSAFANTVGGCLIYGIEEEAGLPTQIVGVEVENFDEFKLHYENLLRTGVAPAIRGVNFHSVPVDGNRCVVIIEVPKSISRPHVVTIRNHFKFYSRNSSGVHQLEVDDLRRAFLASETTATQIRNFRNDRVAQIMEGETYLPLYQGAKVVFHLIPFSSFEVGMKYNWRIQNAEDFLPFLQVSGIPTVRINFDGLISYYENHEHQVFTSTQAYRNGIIEGIDCITLEETGNQKFRHQSFEIRIVQALDRYLESFKKLGIDFPAWACISLIGVKGYTLEIPTPVPLPVNQGQPIEKNELLLPEIQIENPDVPGEIILKPAFDLSWNACGFESSRNYGADGNWTLDKTM